MKKHLFFAGALLMAGTMFATTPTFDGAKIYINPGHGGWNEANDRHMVTIPYGENLASDPSKIDTLGFWESSSNLKVGLFLRDMLEANGAEVMMSRTTNVSGVRDNDKQDYDYQIIGQGTKPAITDSLVGDRDLTQIAKEATEWEADAFISIHSNAASVGAACNYLVFFMPNGPEIEWGSSNWQFNSYRDPADVEMAGVLWPRLLDNPLDVWTESANPASPNIPTTGEYTLLKYGNLGVPGFICEASFHTYMPNTHRYLNTDYQYLEALRFYYAYCDYFDVELPATCCLCGDVRAAQYRATNATYLKYVNGSKDQWQPLNGAIVTLKQGGATIDTYTVDNNWNGIYCFKNVTPGEYQLTFHYDTYTDTTITVTAVAGRTITTNILLNDPNYVAPTVENAVYTDGDLGQLNTVLSTNALTVRRALSNGAYIFVLALDAQKNPYIYRVNREGKVVQQFTTSACRTQSDLADALKVSDIALTTNGYLFGVNYEHTTSDNANMGSLIYKWNTDGSMVEFYHNVGVGGICYESANWFNAYSGESMALMGNSDNFTIFLPMPSYSGTSVGKFRATVLSYNADNESAPWSRTTNYMSPYFISTTFGGRYAALGYGSDFIMSGSTSGHYQFSPVLTGKDTEITHNALRTANAGEMGITIGMYGEKECMFVPSATGVEIVDITSGITSTTSSTMAFTGSIADGYRAAGVISTDAGEKIWLLRNGTLEILPEGENPTNLNQISAAEQPVKFLDNGRLMIRRNGRIFTATGATR